MLQATKEQLFASDWEANKGSLKGMERVCTQSCWYV